MDAFGRPFNPAQHTAIPRIFGILSIIFASIVLFFGLFAALAGAAPSFFDAIGKSTQDPEALATLDAMKSVYGGIGAIGLIQVVMSGVLLAIGIGELKYRRWARAWSVYWGAAALVAVIVLVLISVKVVGPGYEKLFSAAAAAQAQHGGPAPADFGVLSTVFGGTFAGMFVFLYAPYPILLLAFFTRDRVKNAMIL